MTAVVYADPIEPRRGSPWTAEDDAFVSANYRTLGAPKTAAALGRTYTAVCVRACGLGAQKTTHWTIAEDRRLTLLWGRVPIREIAKRMGRGVYGCAVRGTRIGLHRGVQRGMERLKRQAIRTGFSAETLRKILAWAGVQQEEVPSCTGPGVEPRMAYCDADVDEAVAKWLSFEIISEGARARDIDRSVMMELISSGRFKAPKRPKTGRWRVPSEALDKAAAFYRSTETADEGARRHHLVPSTLLGWLRSAGVTKSCHPRVRVERTVIDGIVEARKVSTPTSAAVTSPPSSEDQNPRREASGRKRRPAPPPVAARGAEA
jgi:hypothetical protein